METPKIGERVKFWQEQDRINRELIPRVIKSHELLTRHVENHPDFVSAMAQIQAVEASVEELATATKAQIASVEDEVEKRANETKTQFQVIGTKVEELATETKGQIEAVEARTEELERIAPSPVARLSPYAALALAVVALIVAVVN